MINKLDKYLEWLATITLLTSISLTAVDIYPLNVVLSFAGNFLWIIVAWIWRKWSLLLMSIVICGINIFGLIHHWFW